MVRAKFKCVSKTVEHGSNVIALEPVYQGSEENKQFFKYTPGGKIQLTVVNDAASSQFEVGQEYYVDFTKSDAISPGVVNEAPNLGA